MTSRRPPPTPLPEGEVTAPVKVIWATDRSIWLMTARYERRIGLWMFSIGFGTNIPIPLLLVYQDRLNLDLSAVTGLFGIYAVGLVPALFVAGPLADRWGRRWVTLPAIFGTALVSILFMLAASSIELLYAARFFQGVVSGAAFSVGSAWLVEVAAREASRTGPRTTAVSMTAGFSCGGLVGGLLGQWAPAPLFLAYALHVMLCIVAIVAVWRAPETLIPHVRTVTKTRVPIFHRDTGFASIAVLMALAVCIYGFPATAINALPVLVGFPIFPVAATGLLASITLAAGAIAAPTYTRFGAHAGIVAAACGVLGFAGSAVAAAAPAFAIIILPSAIALGAGGGLALAVSMFRISHMASPSRLGTASAILYACAYIGFAVPFTVAALQSSVPVFASFLILAGMCALLGWQQNRARV